MVDWPKDLIPITWGGHSGGIRLQAQASQRQLDQGGIEVIEFRPTRQPIKLLDDVLRQNGSYITYNAIYNSARFITDDLKKELASSPYTLPNKWKGGRASSLLFIGGGGMGDRVQMTIGLREVAARAGCQVDVCSVKTGEEWLGLDYIGQVGPNFPSKAWVESYEAVFDVEGVIGGPNATTCPRCHNPGTPLHLLLARAMGVEVAADAQPDYVILPGEERLVYLPDKQLPRIGIHLGQASPPRIWPLPHWNDLLTRLAKDFDIVLLGGVGEVPEWTAEALGTQYRPPPPDNIIDYSGHTLNMRALAVAMKTCDVFVGADSGPLHLAGALGIPSVGLYSLFPYEIRGTNLPSIRPMQIPYPSGPKFKDKDGQLHGCDDCFTHVQHGEPLPCGKQFCDMMVGIKPDAVAQAVREMVADSAAYRVTINLEDLRYRRKLKWPECARVLGIKPKDLREARKEKIWRDIEAVHKGLLVMGGQSI